MATGASSAPGILPRTIGSSAPARHPRPASLLHLYGLAALAALDRDDDRAARLAGAAAAHGERGDPVDRRLDATFLQPARTRLGVDQWNAAASEGAALSLQDAITHALDQPRSLPKCQ